MNLYWFVFNILVEAKAPKPIYYLVIGSKAKINTTVYGYPRPASYTYKKKDGTGNYQTVAQYNTASKVMDIGIGRFEINSQNAELTITKVIVSDGGDYQISDGGSNIANFKIEAGCKYLLTIMFLLLQKQIPSLVLITCLML